MLYTRIVYIYTYIFQNFWCHHKKGFDNFTFKKFYPAWYGVSGGFIQCHLHRLNSLHVIYHTNIKIRQYFSLG